MANDKFGRDDNAKENRRMRRRRVGREVK